MISCSSLFFLLFVPVNVEFVSALVAKYLMKVYGVVALWAMPLLYFVLCLFDVCIVHSMLLFLDWYIYGGNILSHCTSSILTISHPQNWMMSLWS